MNAARQLADDDPAFEKLLSDNRERYIQQSRRTKCGQVAELPGRITNNDLSTEETRNEKVPER